MCSPALFPALPPRSSPCYSHSFPPFTCLHLLALLPSHLPPSPGHASFSSSSRPAIVTEVVRAGGKDAESRVLAKYPLPASLLYSSPVHNVNRSSNKLKSVSLTFENKVCFVYTDIPKCLRCSRRNALPVRAIPSYPAYILEDNNYL